MILELKSQTNTITTPQKTINSNVGFLEKQKTQLTKQKQQTHQKNHKPTNQTKKPCQKTHLNIGVNFNVKVFEGCFCLSACLSFVVGLVRFGLVLTLT